MTDVNIVGFDGSGHSGRAVDYARDRAKNSGAHLHLVLVLEWSPYSFHTPEELAERHKRREQELERAYKVVQPVTDDLNKAGVTATCEVRHGHVADILCEIASEKSANQIVIGRTGDSALAQRILGGLVLTLAQMAPVPLTIVP
ncbi:MAG: universal stress protein [Rhizobiales bacterium]|nr:universal stress protein [Hyphomicrobiales bacterium]